MISGRCFLMMEQSDVGKTHDHIVSVTGIDNIIITDGTAWLGDVSYTGLSGSFYVIAKWEEGIRA